jgi:hypothetical protein
MMVDGTDVIMMPGMMLAWILVGFAALIVIAVGVSWLTSGWRERRKGEPGVMEDFEEMGREQVTRDVMTGKVADEGAVSAVHGTSELTSPSATSSPDGRTLLEEQQLERERENVRHEQRFKRAG